MPDQVDEPNPREFIYDIAVRAPTSMLFGLIGLMPGLIIASLIISHYTESVGSPPPHPMTIMFVVFFGGICFAAAFLFAMMNVHNEKHPPLREKYDLDYEGDD